MFRTGSSAFLKAPVDKDRCAACTVDVLFAGMFCGKRQKRGCHAVFWGTALSQGSESLNVLTGFGKQQLLFCFRKFSKGNRLFCCRRIPVCLAGRIVMHGLCQEELCIRHAMPCQESLAGIQKRLKLAVAVCCQQTLKSKGAHVIALAGCKMRVHDCTQKKAGSSELCLFVLLCLPDACQETTCGGNGLSI